MTPSEKFKMVLDRTENGEYGFDWMAAHIDALRIAEVALNHVIENPDCDNSIAIEKALNKIYALIGVSDEHQTTD